MLSDEEEILIKKLSYCEQEYEQDGYLSVGKFEAIKEAVNLIKKQSKEIEELKEKEKNLLIQLKDSEKELLEVCEKLRNSVSKDKIKAILEEYKYTEIGDSEKIIEFYKKIQSLLEKE